MKKLLYVSVLSVLLVPSLSFASSLPDGCQVGYKFSATTGQSCTVLVQDCASGDLFSFVTGQSCSKKVNLPVGCISTDGYSTMLGTRCDGTDVLLQSVQLIPQIQSVPNTIVQNIIPPVQPLPVQSIPQNIPLLQSSVQSSQIFTPTIEQQTQTCQNSYNSATSSINTDITRVQNQITKINQQQDVVDNQFAANGAASSGARNRADEPFNTQKANLQTTIDSDNQALTSLQITLQNCLANITTVVPTQNTTAPVSAPFLKKGVISNVTSAAA